MAVGRLGTLSVVLLISVISASSAWSVSGGPAGTAHGAFPASPFLLSSLDPAAAVPRTVPHASLVGTHLAPSSSAPPDPWIQLSPSSAPYLRGAPGIASSGPLNETLLFGGAGGNSLVPNDTWIYANGSWTNLTGSLTVSPPAVAGEGIVWDANSSEFLMFGGISGYGGISVATTWTFAHDRWTNVTSKSVLTPPSRYGQSMVYDPALGKVVMALGWADYTVVLGNYSTTATTARSDTWEYSGGNWTNVTTSSGTAPAARGFAGTTYDARLGGMVVFAGAGPASNPEYNSTYLFNGTGKWHDISATAGNAPSPRRMSTLAYDPKYGYDLLTGGDDPVVPPYSSIPGGPFNDTWGLVDGKWTNFSGDFPSAPTPRFDSALFYDPTAGALVLFGGCNVLGCVGGLNDTWRFDWNLTASLSATPALVATGSRLTIVATAEGGTTFDSFAYSNLPPACRVAGGNVTTFQCNPNTTGNYSISVTVTEWYNASGVPASSASAVAPTVRVVNTLTLSIAPSRYSIDAGASWWVNSTPAGGSGTYTISYSGLPAGCSSANTTSLRCSPSTANTYTVAVSARDTFGLSDTAMFTVVIQSELQLQLLTSTAVLDVGQNLTVNATISGGGAPYSLVWGALPAGCTPVGNSGLSCSPTNPNTFQISATATDNFAGHAGAITGTIQILAPPSATIVASPIKGDVGTPEVFSVNVSGGLPPYTVAWEFGDGTPGTGATVSHVYQGVGTFHVLAFVTDALGVTTSASVGVDVQAGPQVSLSPQIKAEAGVPVFLSAYWSGGLEPVTFQWAGLPAGCSPPGTNYVDCTPTAPGTSSVTIIMTDANGVSVRSTSTLTVVPALATSVAAAVAWASCPTTNEFANLYANTTGGSGPYQFDWQLGDGTKVLGGGFQEHNFSAPYGWLVSVNVTDSLGGHTNASVRLPGPPACNAVTSSQGSFSPSAIDVGLVLVGVLVGIAVGLLIRRRPPAPTRAGETSVGGEPASPADTMEPDAPQSG